MEKALVSLLALASALTLESLPTASLPTTCVNGRLVWDSTVGAVKVCESNTWQTVVEAPVGTTFPTCGTNMPLTHIRDAGFSCLTEVNLATASSQFDHAPVGCDAGSMASGVSSVGNATCSTSASELTVGALAGQSVSLSNGATGWPTGYVYAACPLKDGGASWAPPSTDCDSAAEAGRICVNANGIWACSGSGWLQFDPI